MLNVDEFYTEYDGGGVRQNVDIDLPDYTDHMPENINMYCRRNLRSHRLQQIHILGTVMAQIMIKYITRVC
jgi:hypothetical protein